MVQHTAAAIFYMNYPAKHFINTRFDEAVFF